MAETFVTGCALRVARSISNPQLETRNSQRSPITCFIGPYSNTPKPQYSCFLWDKPHF